MLTITVSDDYGEVSIVRSNPNGNVYVDMDAFLSICHTAAMGLTYTEKSWQDAVIRLADEYNSQIEKTAVDGDGDGLDDEYIDKYTGSYWVQCDTIASDSPMECDYRERWQQTLQRSKAILLIMKYFNISQDRATEFVDGETARDIGEMVGIGKFENDLEKLGYILTESWI